MFRRSRNLSAALTIFSISTLFISGLVVDVRANDLIPNDDLSGGASVFVFRGSRKRPQERGGMRAFASGGGRHASERRAKMRAQASTAHKRRVAAAKARAAANAKKPKPPERNTRLKQSNLLTAKGEAQFEKGEIAGATVNFREALKLNPNNVAAKEGLSEALTATGIEFAGEIANEAALTYFDEAVKLDPTNEVAYAKIGEIHEAKGRTAEAIVNYEKALKIDPQFTTLYMPLGLGYAGEGKIVEAETYLTKAKEAGFDSPEATMARAMILVKQDRDQEALAAFDSIVKAEPQNGAAIYQKAVIYTKLKQQDKAIAAYQDAVKADPKMAAAWFDLGVIHYNAGEYEKALAAYQEVVKLEPENYKAHANMASTYRQMERFAEANASYKLAEPGNKNNPDLYSEWGYCLGKTNEWDKSVARLNTARELSPNAVDNNNTGWGYYNAARWEKQNNKETEATAKLELGKQYLETAVQQDPNLDAAHLNLGATKNQMGDHDGAVASLNKALSLRSDWVIALNQLGLAFRGKNDLPSAINAFNRVATLDVNNAFGLVNLGEVYHLTGNKKEAKKVHDRLKKINPVLAGRLNDVISGKIVVDKAKQEIRKKVPSIPGVRIPF